jgi:D-serine deaminase-like pyridoxal phosphate-dependent protein
MVAERLQAATAGLTPPYAVVDLAQDDQLRESIMVLVDSIEQCDLIADAAGNQPIKVCMDVDAALRVGPLHLGVRRSPVHSPGQAYALAAEITRRPVLPLTGLMFYDAQIAGLPGWSREPLPWVPRQLRLLRTEGAGEVQTPLRGPAAAALRVGDQVWFRHAKAGELCERFDRLHLVQATGSSTTCPPLGVRGGTSGESADRRRMEELGRQCHQ